MIRIKTYNQFVRLNESTNQPSIREVNLAIRKKYPDLILDKHQGVRSYYWSSDDDVLGLYLAGLESTSVDVANTTHMTLDRWIQEADSIMKDFKVTEKAIPLEDIVKPETQQGLLMMNTHNPAGRAVVLYDFDDKKVLAYAKFRKWSPKDDFWQVDMTAAEKNYGPDLYDLLMMSVYPEPLRPSTTVKPAAQNVWKFYDEKRPDVKKERIELEDDNYEDAYANDDKSGPLDNPDILKLVNTKFTLKPNAQYDKLIALGEEYLKKYNIPKHKIFLIAHKYFWNKYE